MSNPRKISSLSLWVASESTSQAVTPAVGCNLCKAQEVQVHSVCVFNVQAAELVQATQPRLDSRRGSHLTFLYIPVRWRFHPQYLLDLAGRPLRWTTSLSWVMCNCKGFTLPPRVGRGVKSDSCAATSALLFYEVYSDISLTCYQKPCWPLCVTFSLCLRSMCAFCLLISHVTATVLVWVGRECVFFSSLSDLLPSLHCYRLLWASGLYAAANWQFA
jgi:hypothetical protein